MSTAKIGKKEFDLSNRQERDKYWTTVATAVLVGRTIKKARYQTPAEAETMGWGSRGLIINLDDGTELMISQDDEGNGPGAIFTNVVSAQTLPVLY